MASLVKAGILQPHSWFFVHSMLLSELPVELILQISALLPIQDIHALCCTNRALHEIQQQNEHIIYHNAAIFHELVARGTTLSQAAQPVRWLEGAASWKQLCRKYFELEAHWHGQQIDSDAGFRIRLSHSSGANVHRFKIDEEEGTIICTTSQGGLYVSSIQPDRRLWSLPEGHVPQYAHVEYSNGFIVYTTRGNCMEVWRRSRDAYDPEKYLPCQPTDQQLAVATLHPPTSRPGVDSPNLGQRGVYVPFAVLQVPEVARASRVVYPNLVVASSRGRKAFIWDIPNSRLIETIDIKPHPLYPLSEEASQPTDDFGATIHYVELSQDHLFICWDKAMVAYQRRPTKKERRTNSIGIFSISCRLAARPSTVLGDHIHTFPLLEYSSFSPIMPSHNDMTQVESRRLTRALHDPFNVDNLFPSFDAVHVSPDGKDLVVMSSHPCEIVYVQDFAKREEEGNSRLSFRMNVSPKQGVYLAFDGRRILFGGADEDSGSLYVLTLDDIRKSSSAGADTINPTLINFAPFWELNTTSCMQLTDTCIWLNYNSPIRPHLFPRGLLVHHRPCIYCVDLTATEKLAEARPQEYIQEE